mmetsp:Transcript_8384/g.15229  ORF Transcript_8384/g.15229 Transcript_8384/m.15229 type:complete len:229 (-) Transcript_8384:1239-1925(-)
MQRSSAGTMRENKHTATERSNGKCIENALLFFCRYKKGRVPTIKIVIEVYQECKPGKLPSVCYTWTRFFAIFIRGLLLWVIILLYRFNWTRFFSFLNKLKSILVLFITDIISILSLPIKTRFRPSTIDMWSIIPSRHIPIKPKSPIQPQWPERRLPITQIIFPPPGWFFIARQEFLHPLENHPFQRMIHHPHARMRQNRRTGLARQGFVRSVSCRLCCGNEAMAFCGG